MKKFFLFLLFTLFLTPNSFAEATEETAEATEETEETVIEWINNDINFLKELEINYKTEISINKEYEIDLSYLQQKLDIMYPDKEFIFEWNIIWASKQEWSIFKRNFVEKWEKNIILNIYEKSPWTENKIIFSKNFEILVFEKSIPVILSENLNKNELNDYIEISKKDWIYIYILWPYSKSEIEVTNIINELEKYKKTWWLYSDYIWIWWDKDFTFDIISKLNREISLSDLKNIKYNILSISSYNIDILKSYIKNFLANKNWINKIILTNERSKFLMLKQPLSINDLENELKINEYDYINVNLENRWLNKLLFISKFINNLSNKWYSTNSIYIILIIPFILAFISFFKHFIWLSPIWIVIPLILTLLYFKIWLILSLILFTLYTFLNIWIAFILNKYNLLYTPKVSFILTVNLIFFIFILNLWYTYNLIPLDLTDTLYFLMFIILSERLISIITSKEILEYKYNFINTLILTITSFAILQVNLIKILILSYPEIILVLVPMIFLIWRFTWLRVTEYFRFKEVIKNIEE